MAWEVDIPGTGWSSPVYSSKRAWMTSAVTASSSGGEINKSLGAFELANAETLSLIHI